MRLLGLFLGGAVMIGVMACAGGAHALSDSEQNAATLGKALAAAEHCKLSNAHQQLMWTEAQATLSQQARSDRELERAKKQLNKHYEKNRKDEPKGGCRAFVNNNPDPTITTMKTVQQLRQKIDTLNKVMVDQKMTQPEQGQAAEQGAEEIAAPEAASDAVE